MHLNKGVVWISWEWNRICTRPFLKNSFVFFFCFHSAWRCYEKITSSCWPLRIPCAPTTFRINCTRRWRMASFPSSTVRPTIEPTPRAIRMSMPAILPHQRSWPSTYGCCTRMTICIRVISRGIKTIWSIDSQQMDGAICAKCYTDPSSRRHIPTFNDGGPKKWRALPIIISISPSATV